MQDLQMCIYSTLQVAWAQSDSLLWALCMGWSRQCPGRACMEEARSRSPPRTSSPPRCLPSTRCSWARLRYPEPSAAWPVLETTLTPTSTHRKGRYTWAIHSVTHWIFSKAGAKNTFISANYTRYQPLIIDSSILFLLEIISYLFIWLLSISI